MRIFTGLLLAALAMAALPAAPVVAKDKPGHCGEMKFFDKKAKKCVSASKEKKKDEKKDKKGKKKK